MANYSVAQMGVGMRFARSHHSKETIVQGLYLQLLSGLMANEDLMPGQYRIAAVLQQRQRHLVP
ncbi:uncharacterized protein ColSpa_06032 [Colletotrichum spaethianum]|uniref:Uncharacterized protein n=1 Tax=Colletotrichum spaethianum TaxID=700344 RepID=A0AA37LBZ9_9PEZI|nr:uncharacterized protein ColSpa_06032 [Colletotrichum spaethianum]GKT45851.1 hypothetical protein ColSpa_06032 [Colletotrichum spaethianum]